LFKIVEKYKFNDIKKDLFDIEKEVAILNKNSIDTIIKNNKSKHIIFAGFFHGGMEHVQKKVNKGYMIEITPEKLWRQYKNSNLYP
jgi:hypothetical protein